DRRGEGRAAPLRHAFEVAMRASVRRLAVVVGPGRVGIDQVLARGVHIHPGAKVAEVGPGPAVPSDRAYPHHLGEGSRPERSAAGVVTGGGDQHRALAMAVAVPEGLEAQQWEVLARAAAR